MQLSNWSQMSKCGENMSDTLGYHLVCPFFVLNHFELITEQTQNNVETLKK